MRKKFKIILIVVAILVVAVLLDALQAKVFNNSPFIKTTNTYSECFKKDVGILVETDVFNNEKKTYFKWEVKAPILPSCGDNVNE